MKQKKIEIYEYDQEYVDLAIDEICINGPHSVIYKDFININNFEDTVDNRIFFILIYLSRNLYEAEDFHSRVVNIRSLNMISDYYFKINKNVVNP